MENFCLDKKIYIFDIKWRRLFYTILNVTNNSEK